MNSKTLRLGIAIFVLAVAVLLYACVPDVSGVSSWKKSQLTVAEALPPGEGELAAASELVQWTVALEGIPGKDVFELKDAQSILPASMDVRYGNSIVRYEGVRLSDFIAWLGVSEYKDILFVGDSAQETVGADMDGVQLMLAWLQGGASLTSPALISREGVVVGGIRAIITE